MSKTVIAKKFKNDAVIEISKKGFDEVSDDEKRTEIFSDISNVSVKDLGIGILMAELKKNGYDLSIGPAEYTQVHNKMMEESGLPVYDSPLAAVNSLAELFKYYSYKNQK